jgi:hypothetical protein
MPVNLCFTGASAADSPALPTPILAVLGAPAEHTPRLERRLARLNSDAEEAPQNAVALKQAFPEQPELTMQLEMSSSTTSDGGPLHDSELNCLDSLHFGEIAAWEQHLSITDFRLATSRTSPRRGRTTLTKCVLSSCVLLRS